jgi:hypothetical protein
MTKRIVLVSLLLTALATAGQMGNFEGTWTGLSGDLPQAATLVISLKDGLYSLVFTWANGEHWQGRGYLVKGMLVGGFAYSDKDGGFFTVAASGANILMNTFSMDLTKRTPNGIYFKR